MLNGVLQHLGITLFNQRGLQMAVLTGLFQRGSTFYLRIVLPQNHPLRSKYKNGEFVTALGRCSRREAATLGTIKRAEVLGCLGITAISTPAEATELPPTGPVLRDIYNRWKASKSRSPDSLNNCYRSIILYEEFTGNPPITMLTHERGDGFRRWLQQSDRKTTSKIARDRLTWVKSVLKFAAVTLD